VDVVGALLLKLVQLLAPITALLYLTLALIALLNPAQIAMQLTDVDGATQQEVVLKQSRITALSYPILVLIVMLKRVVLLALSLQVVHGAIVLKLV